MRTRKSAPTLTKRQRRRQIIDLLAGHLARMPEAVAVSAPCDSETDAGSDAGSVDKGLQPQVSKSHVSALPAPAPNRRAEELSEVGQTRLDVPAEMPLSVSTLAALPLLQGTTKASSQRGLRLHHPCAVV
jgi:hypothetical protein